MKNELYKLLRACKQKKRKRERERERERESNNSAQKQQQQLLVFGYPTRPFWQSPEFYPCRHSSCRIYPTVKRKEN